jgi:hypothetical protein
VAALLQNAHTSASAGSVDTLLLAAFQAAVTSNNSNGAHICYSKMNAATAVSALQTVNLGRPISTQLSQLLQLWAANRGVHVPVPTVGAADAAGHADDGDAPMGPPAGAAPAPGPVPPVVKLEAVSTPIAVASRTDENLRRLSKEREHAHAAERAALFSQCDCGCASLPSRSPTAAAEARDSDDCLTLDLTFSLNVLNPVLKPKLFRDYLRKCSLVVGTSRRVVHGLFEFLLLEQLNLPGFGELQSWDFKLQFRYAVMALRSNYEPMLRDEKKKQYVHARLSLCGSGLSWLILQWQWFVTLVCHCVAVLCHCRLCCGSALSLPFVLWQCFVTVVWVVAVLCHCRLCCGCALSRSFVLWLCFVTLICVVAVLCHCRLCCDCLFVLHAGLIVVPSLSHT